MIKKKINFLFVFLLLSCFLSTKLLSESFEDDARNKRLGFEQKEIDSIHISRKRLIRDIELGNVKKIKI